MRNVLRQLILSTLIICLIFAFSALPPDSLAHGQSLTQLRNSSAEGNRKAQNLLALRYFKGDGVPQNSTKAACLFTLAAKQGLKKAQFNLGYMYHNGIGVYQDYTMACAWYKAAADQGHSEARKSLNELLQYSSTTNLQEIDRLYSEIMEH